MNKKTKDIWKVIGWALLIVFIGCNIYCWGYIDASNEWEPIVEGYKNLYEDILYSCNADFWMKMSNDWEDLYYQCDTNRNYWMDNCN